MLARFELPPTVHHHAHYRVWQRGGYDMNIWSEKKRLEKLTYMHNNPVRRGLVSEPGRLAVVELAFLLSGRRIASVVGSSILRRRVEAQVGRRRAHDSAEDRFEATT
jgi:hypothetical protein